MSTSGPAGNGPPERGAPQPRGVLKAVATAAVVTTRVQRAAAAKNINFNVPDEEDPTKPKSGTLKGLQAAESVYRRRLQQQYVLNPSVWLLRILIARRTEEVAALALLKKALFQVDSAEVYHECMAFEEADARGLLVCEFFDQSFLRATIRDQEDAEFRRTCYDFEDRLFLVQSEKALRDHIAKRSLDEKAEFLKMAYDTLAQQRHVDRAVALFQHEHEAFRLRVVCEFEESSSRAQLAEFALAIVSGLRDEASKLHAFSVQESAARQVIEAEGVAFFTESMAQEYQRSILMGEEQTAARRLIERDAFRLLTDARNALDSLLDVFYEERREEARRLEAEVERQRQAAFEAHRAMLEQQRADRAAMEDSETTARFNKQPPTFEHRRVATDTAAHQSTSADANDSLDPSLGGRTSLDGDDDEIEFRLVQVGPDLGYQFVEESEWVALLERMEEERWALTKHLASESDARGRLVDVAVNRLERITADEADARIRLYATIEQLKMNFGKLQQHVAELCDDEAQQRATFEWAELESRAAIAKTLSASPLRGAKRPAATAAPSTSTTAPLAPRAGHATATSAAPPSVQAVGSTHVVYVQAPMQAFPANTAWPYPTSPHYALPDRHVANPAPLIRIVGRPLPYDTRIFRRSGPDGNGPVSADLQAVEDEVSAMVEASTLPLGILEYELRSKWARTKQQLLVAIQEKLLEPLHVLAAEIPGGDDIVRRARDASPPRQGASPQYAAKKPPKPLPWQHHPDHMPTSSQQPHSPNKSGSLPRSSIPEPRGPGRPQLLQPLSQAPDASLDRLKRAAAESDAEGRDARLRDMVLWSMRGLAKPPTRLPTGAPKPRAGQPNR
jgi:hypothetical protein